MQRFALLIDDYLCIWKIPPHDNLGPNNSTERKSYKNHENAQEIAKSWKKEQKIM